jgi:hypothetical protein
MVFQAITGAQTPACLFAAIDPVETVTPPFGRRSRKESPDSYVYYLILLLMRGGGADAEGGWWVSYCLGQTRGAGG